MELKHIPPRTQKEEFAIFLAEFPDDAGPYDYAEIKRYLNNNTAGSYTRNLRSYADRVGATVSTRIIREGDEFVIYAHVGPPA